MTIAPKGEQNPAYRATPYLSFCQSRYRWQTMSLSFSDAAKAKQLREYFAQHGRIYIVVDATGDDVQIPDSLKGDPALRLVLNTRMPQTIHIRDDSLDSDFSFSGVAHPCSIPMHTIWAAYLPEGDLEQGVIWDDSVPEMIKAVVQAVRSSMDEADQQDARAAATDESAVPSTITVINGGATGEEDGEPAPRKTGHLRVVK